MSNYLAVGRVALKVADETKMMPKGSSKQGVLAIVNFEGAKLVSR